MSSSSRPWQQTCKLCVSTLSKVDLWIAWGMVVSQNDPKKGWGYYSKWLILDDFGTPLFWETANTCAYIVTTWNNYRILQMCILKPKSNMCKCDYADIRVHEMQCTFEYVQIWFSKDIQFCTARMSIWKKSLFSQLSPTHQPNGQSGSVRDCHQRILTL